MRVLTTDVETPEVSQLRTFITSTIAIANITRLKFPCCGTSLAC